MYCLDDLIFMHRLCISCLHFFFFSPFGGMVKTYQVKLKLTPLPHTKIRVVYQCNPLLPLQQTTRLLLLRARSYLDPAFIFCEPAPMTLLRTPPPPPVQLDALDPSSPLAVLQPAAPLRHGTRYIVAVNGVLGDWGELLPPTPGFQELVDVRIERECDS